MPTNLASILLNTFHILAYHNRCFVYNFQSILCIINEFSSFLCNFYCAGNFAYTSNKRYRNINNITHKPRPFPWVIRIINDINNTGTQRQNIENRIKCLSVRVFSGNRVVAAICKHIATQETLAGGCQFIGVDESANAGIVVTALQVVEPGFSGIAVTVLILTGIL